MTTQTLAPTQITFSITVPAPQWLTRYIAKQRAYRLHRFLQALTPEQQRDIGQYSAVQASLPDQLW